jgi:hypothetical protein
MQPHTITISQNVPATSVTEGEELAPFRRVPRDVTVGMLERSALMAQPAEFFKQFFNGRIPELNERIHLIEQWIQRLTSLNIYENNLYQVQVAYEAPYIHLSIRRRDGSVAKNWRHFQRIKNELVGPEYEAVELFPAESRLVDTANEYHLWVHANSQYRFPLGFAERFVLAAPLVSRINRGAAGAEEKNDQATTIYSDSAVKSHVEA